MLFRSTVVTMNALIDAHAKTSDKAGAVHYFELLTRQPYNLTPTVVTMNALIDAHAKTSDKAGAVHYFKLLTKQPYNLTPDVVIFGSLFKAMVNRRHRKEVVFADFDVLFSEMKRYKIEPHKYIYGQLLLACKYFNLPKQAYIWFDELLNAGIEPTKMLCGVMEEIIGLDAFARYESDRVALFESARRQARADSSRGDRRNRDQGSSNRNSGGSGGGSILRGGGRGGGRGGMLSDGGPRPDARGSGGSGGSGGGRTQPCRSWSGVAGSCRFGGNCKFRHSVL